MSVKLLVCLAALCFGCVLVESAATATIYDNSLASPWADWSWATTKNAADSSVARSGTSFSFVPIAYQALYFASSTTYKFSDYSSISFWIYRTSTTVDLSVTIKLGDTDVQTNAVTAYLTDSSWPTTKWVQGIISFSGLSGSFDRIWFQDKADKAGSIVYLDDITIVGSSLATSAPTAAPTRGPTSAPTKAPTTSGTTAPTSAPSKAPTTAPTKAPTTSGTTTPTSAPSKAPTTAPSQAPTTAPSKAPTAGPTTPATVGPTTTPNGTTDPFVMSLFSTVQTGEATYYGQYTNGGHCMLDPTPPVGVGLTSVAIVSAAYKDSITCGMCISVTGTGVGSGAVASKVTGTRIVFVNNECPSCNPGGLDLGLSGDGVWGITWQAVPCPTTGNIQYMFKDGSSPYWLQLQARNTKYPVLKFELLIGTTWVNLPRQAYNFFGGSVSGVVFPAKIRLTSVNGFVVGDTITAIQPFGTVIAGGVQF